MEQHAPDPVTGRRYDHHFLTRWHEEDLTGGILSSEDAENWLVISLPAEAEEDDLPGREAGTVRRNLSGYNPDNNKMLDTDPAHIVYLKTNAFLGGLKMHVTTETAGFY